ncbi:MAG: PEP-utilizing enzyme [Candidatus Diapherotrites archaeon]|nr:PEP-utilizing enzyme [Candidatus Diapherotrites archaeon]
MSEKLTAIIHEYNGNMLALLLNEYSWLDPKLVRFNGIPVSIAATENSNGNLKWAIHLDEFKKTGDYNFEFFSKDKKLVYEVESNVVECGKKMFALLKELNTKDLGKFSRQELLTYFNKIFDIDKEICFYGFGLVAIDMETGHLTNNCQKILDKKVKQKSLSRKSGDYFSILTTPFEETFSVKENREMLEIAVKAKKGLSKKEIDKLLEAHWKNYCWITYSQSGPELPKSFFEEQLEDLLKKDNLEEMLEHKKTKQKRLKQRFEEALKEVDLTADETHLFELSRKTVFIKGYRKESLVMSFYLASRIVKEISKQFFLPFNDLRFCTPQEIITLLEKGVHPSAKELSERRNYSVNISVWGQTNVLIGEEARKWWKDHVFEEVVEQKDEFSGQIASPGLVKGIVRIVNTSEEMNEFQEGEILVSSATSPDLLPAMKKSSAIITDQGGLTSHAAIVSRELGVPCVIGTKFATKILKDGDRVEVDASHGIIRVLERAKK